MLLIELKLIAATVCFAVASLLTSVKHSATRQCCYFSNELVMRVLDSEIQACTNRHSIIVYFASWVKTSSPTSGFWWLQHLQKPFPCFFERLFLFQNRSSLYKNPVTLTGKVLSQQYLTLGLFTFGFSSNVDDEELNRYCTVTLVAGHSGQECRPNA